MSTPKNTKKNKKTNEQRIGLRHTQRFNDKVNVLSKRFLGGISLKSYKVTYEKLVVTKIHQQFTSYYGSAR